jgi:hypothetical protein
MRGERLAATLIQSAWRGFVCYTDYVFTLSDIVAAQRIARGYLSRKKYCTTIRANLVQKKTEFHSAVLVQKVSRGYQARQKYWYTLGCTMQIQSWWRGRVATKAFKKHVHAVSTLQCFARRILARQQYLQRKFIFMLIQTAEKERTKKEAATRSKEQWDQCRRDEAARVIQRFFLNVKREVDQLVRAQKRRKKWKKKMMKAKKHPDNVEEALLEDAWEATVSHATTLDEEPFTRNYANLGHARSITSMDNGCSANDDNESVGQMSRASMVDPPGSVASSSMRGSTTGSRSLYRQQQLQEENRYRLPPMARPEKPSSVVRLHHEYADDSSVFSQLTGSTMTYARPAHHVRVFRKVAVNDMDDEFQLEEAFIDAEIFHAKERRQMAGSRRPSSSTRAPRPSSTRKSTGGISVASQSSTTRRASHGGIVRTDSRDSRMSHDDGIVWTHSTGAESQASLKSTHSNRGDSRRQPSGTRILTSSNNY